MASKLQDKKTKRGEGMSDKVVKLPGMAHQTLSDQENLEITVTVPKSVMVEALENQRMWQLLWGSFLFEEFAQAALELKGFVLNGYKAVTTNEEMMACREKMLKLEAPLPVLKLATDNPNVAPDGKTWEEKLVTHFKELGKRQKAEEAKKKGKK